MGGRSSGSYQPAPMPHQPQQTQQPMSASLLPSMMPTTYAGGIQPSWGQPLGQLPSGTPMSIPGGPVMMNQGGAVAPGFGPAINNMAQPMSTGVSTGIPSTMHANSGMEMSMPGGPVMMHQGQSTTAPQAQPAAMPQAQSAAVPQPTGGLQATAQPTQQPSFPVTRAYAPRTI